jgi:hypothetical protein
MPIAIKNTTDQLSKIGNKLYSVMDELTAKTISTSTANSISRVACQAIKAHATGVMLVNQQEIERDKIILQRDRIRERQDRTKTTK